MKKINTTWFFCISLFLILFISFNSFGQLSSLEWALQAGGTGDSYVYCNAIDNEGNLYATGYYYGTMTFGTISLTSEGERDVFISKQDINGDFVWVKSIGGSSMDIGRGIALDNGGNIYVTGYFKGTSDFDPGTATQLRSSSGLEDIFVSKFDNDGNYVWTKVMGGAGSSDQALSIALDTDGNVFTTGAFDGTADFNPGFAISNMSSAGSFDIFISKLDNDGNFVWSERFGGTGGQAGNKIVTDTAGNIYIGGYFSDVFGDANFNSDELAAPVHLPYSGDYDIFVGKYNNDGAYIWAKGMGGPGRDNCNSIAVDVTGNTYFAGTFSGTADFDPGAGSANLTSAGDYDDIVGKLDADGDYVWAKRFGGINADYCYDIAVDGMGNVYSVGVFIGTVDFDPNDDVANLTANGLGDFFISELDSDGNYLNAVGMGESGLCIGLGIKVADDGAVFTSGIFDDSVIFSTAGGDTELISAGANDIFSLRFFDIALPINISFFEAVPKGNTAVLDWVAEHATEENGFVIERSTDGKKWQPIGAVASSSGSKYSFIDAKPASFVDYYRLKQIDRGNKTTYSEVKRVLFNNLSETILFYPNPAKERILFSEIKDGIVFIYDQAGQVIKQVRVGHSSSSIDISELQNGIYYVRYLADSGQSRDGSLIVIN